MKYQKNFNILYCNFNFGKFWLVAILTILIGDVNLDNPDLSSTVRVQIFLQL